MTFQTCSCQVEEEGEWALSTVAVRAGGRGLLYPQVVFLLFPLDPVEGLLLGVDAEREAAGPGGKDAILNRELIRGQSLGAPPGRDSKKGN